MASVVFSVILSVMKRMGEEIYNIEALGKLTGLNRRTIRYYVQRGILQKPHGGGRGHYYTGEHANRIREIQRLREQGVPIEKMREIFSEPQKINQAEEKIATSSVYREEIWHRVTIGEEIEISFRKGGLSERDRGDIIRYITTRLQEEGENHG